MKLKEAEVLKLIKRLLHLAYTHLHFTEGNLPNVKYSNAIITSIRYMSNRKFNDFKVKTTYNFRNLLKQI